MDLAEIIGRLEGAEGPDREIDAILMQMAGDQVVFRGRMGWEWRAEGRGIWSGLPSPTASLDAALTLVARTLPGWAWEVGNEPGREAWAYVYPDIKTAGSSRAAATPALAVLSALCRALQAAEPTDLSQRREAPIATGTGGTI